MDWLPSRSKLLCRVKIIKAYETWRASVRERLRAHNGKSSAHVVAQHFGRCEETYLLNAPRSVLCGFVGVLVFTLRLRRIPCQTILTQPDRTGLTMCQVACDDGFAGLGALAPLTQPV